MVPAVQPTAALALATLLLAAGARAGAGRAGAEAGTGTGAGAGGVEAPEVQSPPPLVEIRGNVLFNPWAYRALLSLPPGAGADAGTAAKVRAQIQAFLQRAGYDLSRVTAQVEGGRIAAEVDEGQLDKVLVLGVGAWDAVRFRLDLDLPGDVYNRPLLEERLGALCARYRLLRCTPVLRAVDPVAGAQPGIGALERLEQVPGASALVPGELVRPPRAFELQLQLEPPPQRTGFWPSVDVGAPDGLLLGVSGYLADLPLAGSSVETQARAGGNLRSHLDGTGSRLVFTRGEAEARARLPSAGILHPALGLRAEVLSRQRGDLGIDGILQGRLEAALVADVAPPGGFLEVAVGAGLQHSQLFDSQLVAPVDPVVGATPNALTRPFLLAFARLDFSPDELRRDRHQLLEALARARSGPGSPLDLSGGELFLDGRYRRYFGLGWDEAWIRTHVRYRGGDVLYMDEAPLADDLRGGLADVWVRKQATLLTEFRLSLVRDLLKVSVFDALSAYQKLQSRTPTDERLRGALALGAGLHGLAWTLLTVDLYATVAWSSDGAFGAGISLEIHEAYR